MSVRPHGEVQRNRDNDDNRVYSLCPQTGGVAALSNALLGSEARRERDPGAGGGASAVGGGDVDSDVGGVREALSSVSERNDQHTAEDHRRPFPGCQKRKLQMHRKPCKVFARFVKSYVCVVDEFGCHGFGARRHVCDREARFPAPRSCLAYLYSYIKRLK